MREDHGDHESSNDATLLVRIVFTAKVIEWRGPSPFFFASIPPRDAAAIRDAARSASYGWGMVPVRVAIDGFDFRTALFPKDGNYLLPLKSAVRARSGIALGDTVRFALEVHRDRDRLP